MKISSLIIAFVFVNSITSIALAQTPAEKIRNKEKPQLMIMGTFHFRDQGLDGYKPKFSVDILSEKRQKEVEALVDEIAKFKPTKIAIEWKKDKDQRITDSLYNEYLAGRYKLRENEIFQVAFRLGKKLGHKKLYCVDAPSRGFENIPDKKVWSEQNNQKKYLDTTYGPMYDVWLKSEDSLKAVKTLKDHLLYLNTEESQMLNLGLYLFGSFRLAANDEYVGADGVMWWYNRNLRIFTNLLQLAENKNDRIFLLIGAGHVPIIKHAAKASPEVKYIEITDYIKQ